MDTQLLLWINGAHCPWMDQVMSLYSSRIIWVPLYLLLLILLKRQLRDWKCWFLCVGVIALMILVSDQLCASILRPWIGRLRPSNPMNGISSLVHIVNGHRGGPYGFPSCHAANCFCVAVFVSRMMKRRWLTCVLLAWALFMGYSRIYLGLHYPGDVLAGMLIGSVIALLSAGLLNRMLWHNRMPKKESRL